MEYKLLDIKEADYGCEELPEGESVKCLLVLEKTENVLKETACSCQISTTTGRQETTGSKVYAEIPDSLATELGLTTGIIISDDELNEMKLGNAPKNWDDIENRHYYQTPIGPVCMSNKEYREYKNN